MPIKNVLKLLDSIKEGVSFEDTTNSYGTQTLENLTSAYQYLLEDCFEREISEKELMVTNSLVRNIPCQQNYRAFPVNVTNRGAASLNPELITPVMNRLIYLINDNSLTVEERAAIAQGGIYYVQPFEDGNKRTGRAIMDKVLLENRYNLVKFGDRENYINSLFEVCDNLKKDKNEGQLLERKKSFEPLTSIIRDSQN